MGRVLPVGKRDPPELPNIFRGTALQWRRCVRSGTSTGPWMPRRGTRGLVAGGMRLKPLAGQPLGFGYLFASHPLLE